MKKIVLKRFEQKDGSYQVRLGNGTVHSFPSKRLLFQFLTRTNKFLTSRAFDIHAIYMELWQEYQRCWFYFGSGQNYKWSLHFLDYKRCKEELEACEDHILRAIGQSDWDSGNHYSFHSLNTAISCQKGVIKTIIPLFKSRSQTAELYRMNCLLERLLSAESKIHHYAQIEATHHISQTRLFRHGS